MPTYDIPDGDSVTIINPQRNYSTICMTCFKQWHGSRQWRQAVSHVKMMPQLEPGHDHHILRVQWVQDDDPWTHGRKYQVVSRYTSKVFLGKTPGERKQQMYMFFDHLINPDTHGFIAYKLAPMPRKISKEARCLDCNTVIIGHGCLDAGNYHQCQKHHRVAYTKKAPRKLQDKGIHTEICLLHQGYLRPDEHLRPGRSKGPDCFISTEELLALKKLPIAERSAQCDWTPTYKRTLVREREEREAYHRPVATSNELREGPPPATQGRPAFKIQDTQSMSLMDFARYTKEKLAYEKLHGPVEPD